MKKINKFLTSIALICLSESKYISKYLCLQSEYGVPSSFYEKEEEVNNTIQATPKLLLIPIGIVLVGLIGLFTYKQIKKSKK